MRVVFANVTQCFVYADNLEKPEGMIFKRFSIPEYIAYFKSLDPDIVCLSEVLIDDEAGNSEFVAQLSSETGLEYIRTLRSEDSWIYVGKHYGMAILSRYPIREYEEFKLPNPKFEVMKSDGDHWVLHDKYAQYAKLELEGNHLNLFNLHYFPVHHFNKKIQSKEMAPYRKALVEVFLSKGFDKPTIIAGDFNDKEAALSEVFPELFLSRELDEAIETETTILDGTDQIDHILYTVNSMKLLNARAEKFLSDHYALIADFN